MRLLGPHVAVSTMVLVLVVALSAHAHEGAHGDPELLGHWRAQVHFVFQWAHLVAFGLWVGGMLAATRLPTLSLERLLFTSWALFLVSLGTGSYNMEFGAATPDPPDIFSLPGLSGRWEFGDAYIVLIGVKQALPVLAVLWTATVTVAHLRRPPEAGRERLRTWFVAGSIALGFTVAAVVAMVFPGCRSATIHTTSGRTASGCPPGARRTRWSSRRCSGRPRRSSRRRPSAGSRCGSR